MITYFDTSSLVKLYVDEEFSDTVSALLDTCDVAATSIIAYAEARAAFARRHREKVLPSIDYRKIVSNFNSDWINFVILNISHDLIILAGDFAEKHALRGFDAIHLASALTLKQKTDAEVSFSCFDSKLNLAAKQVSLQIG